MTFSAAPLPEAHQVPFLEALIKFSTFFSPLSLSSKGGVSQPTFRKDCAELIEADKLGALAKLLVANSSVLWKYSSGKEIESGYILLCSLMRDSSLDEQSSLAVDLANSLTRVEENKDATLQSRLLATVFNFFPSSKFGVLIAFVKHCILEKDDSVIEAQFQHISNWCQEWKLKGEEREELYATVTQLFQVCNHEKLAYKSLLAAISWDSSAKNTAKSTQNLAAQCVAAALALPGLYELDVLLALPPVASLHSADAPVTIYSCIISAQFNVSNYSFYYSILYCIVLFIA